MIKHKQLFKHNPPHSYGDCQRTVYACLLDKNPEDIPNFGLHYGDGAKFYQAVDEYLTSQNLARICIAFQDKLENILKSMHSQNPDVYYMLSGRSKNDTNHIVICLNDSIYWDTAIDDSGIVGPCDTGYYWVDFLVPSFLVKK